MYNMHISVTLLCDELSFKEIFIKLNYTLSAMLKVFFYIKVLNLTKGVAIQCII
ncbi:hypothetical protein HMPREF0216_02752 [Clostridium celatum DSM 1785]|uniref:Uncharacterized protein n=1 Tax=Clostridium celatum DSM 1785 TaxID=545697 RepID=L1Q7R2_9CLOT|nr:hypothetical protein HMPREF0216_02752 [Clostridium celatum DSM 1785]